MAHLYVATVVFATENIIRKDDLQEFITDALSCWGGQLHPDDPLFSSLNIKSADTRRVALYKTTVPVAEE